MEPNQKTPYIKLHDYQPKKRSPTESGDTKLPGSMKNRYFSNENIVPTTSSADDLKAQLEKSRGLILEDDLIATNQVAQPESEAFVKRRDYLLTKLLKAHTLPGLDETPVLPKISVENKSASRAAARTSTFQDEFIPLFATKPDSNSKKSALKESSSDSDDDEDDEDEDCDVKIVKEKAYNPKLNSLENYRGPYPIDCLYRSRRVIIDEFMPNSKATNRSNFFDRRFEILKMKLEVTSKFDTDNRLRNKIKRESAEKRQEILDKINATDRRFSYFMSTLKSPKKNQKMVFASDSDSGQDFVKETKASTSSDVINLVANKKRKKGKQSIVLDSDDEEDNEADVINMINQAEYCVNMSDQDIDEEDSKCKQFDKYNASRNKKRKLENTGLNLKSFFEGQKFSNSKTELIGFLDRRQL